MRGRWDDFGSYFPPSRPRAAKGGIRAQSKRGAFAESWWAQRWISVLESFDIGARLQRGRRYARSGQVLSIDIQTGKITALVQGSRPSPYEVIIDVRQLPRTAWKKVAAAAASQAVFASKLLGGQMPREMEDAFRAQGVTLFPARNEDLRTNCSCPDWSNPCKHIAAVYYLLGEEFDRDPFLIFRMRGMGREEFLSMLGESGPALQVEAVQLPPEPLPASPAEFYRVGSLENEAPSESPPAGSGAALARRLGKFPFWRGSVPLDEFLDATYNAAARRATRALGGD
jgi:uncharacterized Zn finger protein